MGLSAETGSYTKTKTGSGQSDTINLVDSNLTPKIIILRATAAGALGGFDTYCALGFGISDGTNEVAMNCQSTDNVGTTNTVTTASATRALMIGLPGSASMEANITNIAQGSFTITYTINISTQFRIAWEVIGGDDITNTAGGIASHFNDATTDVVKQFTPLTFQPDAIWFIDHGGVNIPGSVQQLFPSIGFASGPSSQMCMVGFSRDNIGTSRTARMLRTNRCNVQPSFDGGGNPIEFRSNEFLQFVNNGWEWTQRVGVVANRKFLYFAIKGGTWGVGHSTTRTTPGSQTLNVGFVPKLFMPFSVSSILTNTFENDCALTIGASDETRENSTLAVDKNNVATTEGGASVVETSVMQTTSGANPSAGPTITANPTVTDFADPNVVLNYPAGDSAARHFSYVVAGEPTPLPATPGVNHEPRLASTINDVTINSSVHDLLISPD